MSDYELSPGEIATIEHEDKNTGHDAQCVVVSWRLNLFVTTIALRSASPDEYILRLKRNAASSTVQ